MIKVVSRFEAPGRAGVSDTDPGGAERRNERSNLMEQKFIKRLLHLVLLAAVVGSALFGAFDISSPFTNSAFANGYPGGGAGPACCKVGKDCVKANSTCRVPVNGERECSPTMPNYCT